MMRIKFFLILSAAPLLLFLSCSGDSSDDFGDPPTPETCFCDPDGIGVYLGWVEENYPDIAELRTIGYSEENRPIYALELSDNPGTAETEPAVLINGSIHGNEQLAGGLVLKLIEHLILAASEDVSCTREEIERADYLLENFKLHFIPVVNPDGLDNGSRYNSNLVDLNRNFGYNWYEPEANNGSAAFDQKESAAVRDDFMEKGYVLALNLHTTAPASASNIGIYATWDAITTNEGGITEEEFINTYLPNYELIEQFGEEYAASVLSYDNYLFEDFHYQEGADWYVMYGSMADWALGERGAVSYTLEIFGDQNFTTADTYQLDQCFLVHSDAALDLIKKAETGCGGTVKNAAGNPVEDAEITLDYTGAGKAFTPREYTDLKGYTTEKGLFRFLTGEGSYQITISCNGYQNLVTNIIVDESGQTSTDGGSSYSRFPQYTLTDE